MKVQIQWNWRVDKHAFKEKTKRKKEQLKLKQTKWFYVWLRSKLLPRIKPFIATLVPNWANRTTATTTTEAKARAQLHKQTTVRESARFYSHMRRRNGQPTMWTKSWKIGCCCNRRIIVALLIATLMMHNSRQVHGVLQGVPTWM